MPKETMTPRERWLAVLERRKPDRVPMDYWATEEASQKLIKHLGCADLSEVFKKLHIDNPLDVWPSYCGPKLSAKTNAFGCRFRTITYETGSYDECISHPLAEYETVEEIKKNYKWPSADWWDYSAIKGQVEGHEDKPIRGGHSEPFLTYCELRGQEQGYMDMILNPEMVHYCLDRLFELAYTDTARIYEQIPGKVMITYVAEDLGSQESLLFSIESIREFLLPRMKRVMDLAH
jgi:uroporphyrinogen decarboxylase